MAGSITNAHGETAKHTQLKRLAFLWAQARGYSACALEVSLPPLPVSSRRGSVSTGAQEGWVHSHL